MATKSLNTQTRSSLLRARAQAFCQAFLDGEPPDKILGEFFLPDAKITEHGPRGGVASSSPTSAKPSHPPLAFLGQTFQGRNFTSSSSSLSSKSPESIAQRNLEDYFSILSSVLSFHPSPSTFPAPSEFIVDPEANAVAVVGKGRFESTETGRGWDECFIYRLSGWEEGDECKGPRMSHWEIWADTLSAWAAVQKAGHGME